MITLVTFDDRHFPSLKIGGVTRKIHGNEWWRRISADCWSLRLRGSRLCVRQGEGNWCWRCITVRAAAVDPSHHPAFLMAEAHADRPTATSQHVPLTQGSDSPIMAPTPPLPASDSADASSKRPIVAIAISATVAPIQRPSRPGRPCSSAIAIAAKNTIDHAAPAQTCNTINTGKGRACVQAISRIVPTKPARTIVLAAIEARPRGIPGSARATATPASSPS